MSTFFEMLSALGTSIDVLVISKTAIKTLRKFFSEKTDSENKITIEGIEYFKNSSNKEAVNNLLHIIEHTKVREKPKKSLLHKFRSDSDIAKSHIEYTRYAKALLDLKLLATEVFLCKEILHAKVTSRLIETCNDEIKKLRKVNYEVLLSLEPVLGTLNKQKEETDKQILEYEKPYIIYITLTEKDMVQHLTSETSSLEFKSCLDNVKSTDLQPRYGDSVSEWLPLDSNSKLKIEDVIEDLNQKLYQKDSAVLKDWQIKKFSFSIEIPWEEQEKELLQLYEQLALCFTIVDPICLNQSHNDVVRLLLRRFEKETKFIFFVSDLFYHPEVKEYANLKTRKVIRSTFKPSYFQIHDYNKLFDELYVALKGWNTKIHQMERGEELSNQIFKF